jgi:ubiquitin-protein ligase
MATKRLTKEWQHLHKSPIEYCEFTLPNGDEDIYHWRAMISGPVSTPYAGGTFVLDIVFPTTYPFKAPDIKFTTRIYHPNVKSETGEICNDMINGSWSPTLNVRHCIKTLYNMMLSPDSDHPLEVEIAQQMLEKPKEFEKTAVKWTKEYAK